MQFTSFSPLFYPLLFTLASSQMVRVGSPHSTTTTMRTTVKSSITSTITRPIAAATLMTTRPVMVITAPVKPSTTIATSVKPSTTIATSVRPSTHTTTSSVGPVVTDAAYIDTVIRHHNVHRANHSATDISWSPSLAETARQIGSSCVFAHNTTANGGGYGQNIGAGYPSTNMGDFITGGLYNGEVNAYTYYGVEPDINTFSQWGHFTQIVWKGTTAVGCYTYDCSATGLGNTGGGGVPPYFTVCNYSPPGNYIGSFKANIGASLHHSSVDGTYGCGSAVNCVST